MLVKFNLYFGLKFPSPILSWFIDNFVLIRILDFVFGSFFLLTFYQTVMYARYVNMIILTNIKYVSTSPVSSNGGFFTFLCFFLDFEWCIYAYHRRSGTGLAQK